MVNLEADRWMIILGKDLHEHQKKERELCKRLVHKVLEENKQHRKEFSFLKRLIIDPYMLVRVLEDPWQTQTMMEIHYTTRSVWHRKGHCIARMHVYNKDKIEKIGINLKDSDRRAKDLGKIVQDFSEEYNIPYFYTSN